MRIGNPLNLRKEGVGKIFVNLKLVSNKFDPMSCQIRSRCTPCASIQGSPTHFHLTRTEAFSKFDEVLMITILLQPDHEMRTSGSIGSDHDPLSYRHTWLNLPVFTRTAHSCYWDIDKYRGRGGETFSDIHLDFRGKNSWCSLNRKIDGPQAEGLPESLPKTEPQQID